MPNQNTATANFPGHMYHPIISTYLDNKAVTDTADFLRTGLPSCRAQTKKAL